MNNLMLMLERIIPEGTDKFRIRYTLLQLILEYQPIGRRSLTTKSTYSERTVRSAVDVLQKQGLVQINHSGMVVTELGKHVLDELYTAFGQLEVFPMLENKLSKYFETQQVVVVPGDVDQDESVKWRLGKTAGALLNDLMEDCKIISVTGGSTIFKMVEVYKEQCTCPQNLTIISARGSVGSKMEFQASTIAMMLAEKLGATYEVLNIPDNLSQASIETIRQEPHIGKTLQKMEKSDMIILGLGDAMKMARRRNEDIEVQQLLQEKGAVAEAFRYYFDEKGQVVYSASNIGLSLELAQKIKKRIVVAGGKSKAKALMATKKILKNSYLVIDEGVARAILEAIKN